MYRVVRLVEQWASQFIHDSAAADARVGELVTRALGDDPAIQLLISEAAGGAVTERTRTRALLALEEEAERNPSFGRELRAAMGPSDDFAAPANGIAPIRPALVTASIGERGEEAVISDAPNVVKPLFFGRDDAEHDMADGLLREGFVATTVYEEVLAGRKNLIVGRKGSGKSAICMRMATSDPGPDRSYLITPDDAAGEVLREFTLEGLTAPAAKALLWRYVFALHAARLLVRHPRAVGRQRRRPASVGVLERFLRDNGELDDQSLYHRVTRAGRSLVSSVSLEAFGAKLAVTTNNAPAGVRASRQLEIVEAGVRQVFDDLDWVERTGPLLILVDQLEQIWSSEPESAALVIGLLLASKHVALTYGKALRCASFVRSDIYDALDFSDADKFHSDEVRISWTSHQLHELAITRAGVALGRRLTPDELWGEVFPPRILGEPTADYLFSRSLPRPRDAIQFLNQCRDTAHGNGHHLITATDVLDATLVFSRWKILDLAKEYRVRFPFLSSLLPIFRDIGYELTRTSIARMFGPFRQGLADRHPAYTHLLDPDSVIELLFSVGFLGVRRREGYVYAGTAETSIRPQESEFCIHPCFRPALNATRPTEQSVVNRVTGDVVGTVMQAGAVHGTIHIGGAVAGHDVDIPPPPPEASRS
ncbi:hypothetical protein [Amycolatopsis sp. NPDC049159]|uniref:P-loop ATPase, Sll1717 family n=1 Tax=unclassified Amycolatopsis TaxID=2618356 RepID=UPI0033F650B3